MADIRFHHTVDPFGQALEGYRTGVKDQYDRALKQVQMYNTLERLKLAKSANGRAGAMHALNILNAKERLKTLRDNNQYLPEHLKTRNEAERLKLENLAGEADLSKQQRVLDARDLEKTHQQKIDMEDARIGYTKRRALDKTPPPFTPKPNIQISPPAQSPIPGRMSLGGPKEDNPFEESLGGERKNPGKHGMEGYVPRQYDGSLDNPLESNPWETEYQRARDPWEPTVRPADEEDDDEEYSADVASILGR